MWHFMASSGDAHPPLWHGRERYNLYRLHNLKLVVNEGKWWYHNARAVTSFQFLNTLNTIGGDYCRWSFFRGQRVLVPLDRILLPSVDQSGCVWCVVILLSLLSKWHKRTCRVVLCVVSMNKLFVAIEKKAAYVPLLSFVPSSSSALVFFRNHHDLSTA